MFQPSSSLILAIIAAGMLVSVYYTVLILFHWSYDCENEEHVSLVTAARQSDLQNRTPIFGETAWFIMTVSAFWALTCKAACQNSTKLVLQLQWKYDGSDEES